MSDTREYIIDKAYELFMNSSYEGVSISDISKAVELTKGALYHHFESKEAIFKAVIDKYLIIRITNSYSDDKTFAQLIHETLNDVTNTIKSIFGDKQNYLPVSYLALMIDAMRHYPGFFNEHLNLMENEIEKCRMVMDNAIKRGEIRQDINTEIMAVNYFSLSTGMAINILQNNTPETVLTLLQKQLTEFYKLLKV